jgi:mRNA interferase MazF
MVCRPFALSILDHVGIVHRSRLGAVVATLPEQRWSEVERALLVACGFNEKEMQGS